MDSDFGDALDFPLVLPPVDTFLAVYDKTLAKLK